MVTLTALLKLLSHSTNTQEYRKCHDGLSLKKKTLSHYKTLCNGTRASLSPHELLWLCCMVVDSLWNREMPACSCCCVWCCQVYNVVYGGTDQLLLPFSGGHGVCSAWTSGCESSDFSAAPLFQTGLLLIHVCSRTAPFIISNNNSYANSHWTEPTVPRSDSSPCQAGARPTTLDHH